MAADIIAIDMVDIRYPTMKPNRVEKICYIP